MTIGVIAGGMGAFALLKGGIQHLKMLGSKNKAKAKMEKMEAEMDAEAKKAEAKKEKKKNGDDNKSKKVEGKRLRRREMRWEDAF
jgi:hypothetical protein